MSQVSMEYLEEERKKLWGKLLELEGQLNALHKSDHILAQGKQAEELEEERKVLWDRLEELELSVAKKTSDYESEARSASKKASEFRNRCRESKDKVDEYVSTIESALHAIEKVSDEARYNLQETNENKDHIISIRDQAKQGLTDILGKKSELEEHVRNLEKAFEEHPELDEEIERLNTAFVDSEGLHTKITSVYKEALRKKKEVDTAYEEINGYTHIDEDTEEETYVEGLKDKLDVTYTSLEEGFENMKSDFSSYSEEVRHQFTSFITQKGEEFYSRAKEWDKGYDKVLTKINNLLPNALTVGLSHAYSSKKGEEEKERKSLVIRFNVGIAGLILVSLIPFGVSIDSLVGGLPLEEVITRMPRLVLAILPIYIPVMWVAYSANRKMNLSKRLIEEYAHKEVLSRTFEGLSKQINDIEDADTSSELRLKLLYNVLEVSAENPGKLISDYNKSDHPLMDALDKSVKLANAVDKLADIPGLSKLSTVLDKKSKRITKEQEQKIEEVLEDHVDE